MRVVYLHQYFNTPAMAGGTRSYEMARRLVAAGHDVHMVTTWREPTERRGWFVTEEAGIHVHWLPVRYSNHMAFADRMRAFFRFAWSAARRAACIPADVVFATSTPLTIALPGYYASRRQRIPMVFEIRDLWPDVPIAVGALNNRFLVKLARGLEQFAYRSSERVVALAPGMRETVIARGVAPDRVTVIPNGCDFDVFDSRREETDALVLPRPGTAIVYAGTMGLANGVEYIPQLAAELSRVCGTARVNFYLIGDGGRRGVAEGEAERLGVLNETVFFIGSVPKREAARWLRAADATIMTYAGPEILYRDSVSNKFFDSLAAGKPVFANFRGFSTLTAEAAGAGFILDADPARAAGELCDLIRREGALLDAGEAAYDLARTRFSRDDLAADLQKVLRDTVDGASL